MKNEWDEFNNIPYNSVIGRMFLGKNIGDSIKLKHNEEKEVFEIMAII